MNTGFRHFQAPFNNAFESDTSLIQNNQLLSDDGARSSKRRNSLRLLEELEKWCQSEVQSDGQQSAQDRARTQSYVDLAASSTTLWSNKRRRTENISLSQSSERSSSFADLLQTFDPQELKDAIASGSIFTSSEFSAQNPVINNNASYNTAAEQMNYAAMRGASSFNSSITGSNSHSNSSNMTLTPLTEQPLLPPLCSDVQQASSSANYSKTFQQQSSQPQHLQIIPQHHKLADNFRFVESMEFSVQTQTLLQEWDRSMGLKACHSKTMMATMHSRKKLLALSSNKIPLWKIPTTFVGGVPLALAKSKSSSPSSLSYGNPIGHRLKRNSQTATMA